MQLNDEQSAAITAMQMFLRNTSEKFFLLSGYAGTGKTFCIQQLINKIRGRLIFTAPTNKATKVLRDTLTSKDYTPECRTIFSLLGLRLEANGEVKELTIPEDPICLTQYAAIIVDEASMVNSSLMEFIERAAETQNLKFIFLGDEAQLPPVGETASKIWQNHDVRFELTKVMRHDNQILELASSIRKQISHPAPTLTRATANANGEGVWDCEKSDFERRIFEAADQGRFSKPNCAKAIAWRNTAVDLLNFQIRARLFDNAATVQWLPDDRIILMEPAKDREGKPIASTDEEGKVIRATLDWHPEWREFKIWEISVITDDGIVLQLRVLHKDYQEAFDRKARELADSAKFNHKRWKLFWEFKEAFHKIRHAYAITAHRAQGSTYEAVFVDWRDILSNRSRTEAFKCLYVACTRPKKELYLG